MLVEESAVADAIARTRRCACIRHPPTSSGSRAVLAGAERPLVVVGGAPWSAECARRADGLVRRGRASGRGGLALPGLRRQHARPSTPAISALGPDPRLARRVRDADVLLVIGDRLSEITTSGYTLLEVPNPAQALIHVHPDPDELGRVYAPALAVAASPDVVRARALGPAAARPVRGWASRPGARTRTTSTTSDHARLPGEFDMVRGDGDDARTASGGRHPHERRRQFLRLGAPLLRVPALHDAARPDERCDGLRRPRRGGGEADASRSGSWWRSRATATS